MCLYCAPGSSRPGMDRARVLDLLAILEHPDALSTEAALRIAGALLAWAGQPGPGLRCEVVAREPPSDNRA